MNFASPQLEAAVALTEASGRAGCDPSRKRCEVGSGTTREPHQCHLQEWREIGEIGRDLKDCGVA